MWRAACCAQTYWSVQGQVWAEAKADKTSDVGKWFSWGPESCEGVAPCDGSNVKVPGVGCAQGSWGSKGSDPKTEGIQSALASFGSAEYADYMVDAMANSWTKNLGIDGYTEDCSANYQCMMQLSDPEKGSLPDWAAIVGRVRKQQPQLVMSGEGYGSWAEMIIADANIGGQGTGNYHDAMQKAVMDGDASDLEKFASTSGADAATVVCYLNPAYDGVQPGGCPTMCTLLTPGACTVALSFLGDESGACVQTSATARRQSRTSRSTGSGSPSRPAAASCPSTTVRLTHTLRSCLLPRTVGASAPCWLVPELLLLLVRADDPESSCAGWAGCSFWSHGKPGEYSNGCPSRFNEVTDATVAANRRLVERDERPARGGRQGVAALGLHQAPGPEPAGSANEAQHPQRGARSSSGDREGGAAWLHSIPARELLRRRGRCRDRQGRRPRPQRRAVYQALRRRRDVRLRHVLLRGVVGQLRKGRLLEARAVRPRSVLQGPADVADQRAREEERAQAASAAAQPREGGAGV